MYLSDMTSPFWAHCVGVGLAELTHKICDCDHEREQFFVTGRLRTVVRSSILEMVPPRPSDLGSGAVVYDSKILTFASS
jgi:hypothetical protein